MIWYYFRLFRDIIDEVYYGWREAMDNDELEKKIALKEAAGENISEEEKAKLPPPLQPYVKRERFHGTGPLRIGQVFTFREDIYSLLFIANVRSDFKDQCVDDAY